MKLNPKPSTPNPVYEQLKSFKAGENIVQQGDDVQALCVLIEGAATVEVQDAMEGDTNGDTKGDTSVRTYMPGDFFGELALLTGQISVHTCVCLSSVRMHICVCPVCIRVYVCGMCQFVRVCVRAPHVKPCVCVCVCVNLPKATPMHPC